MSTIFPDDFLVSLPHHFINTNRMYRNKALAKVLDELLQENHTRFARAFPLYPKSLSSAINTMSFIATYYVKDFQLLNARAAQCLQAPDGLSDLTEEHFESHWEDVKQSIVPHLGINVDIGRMLESANSQQCRVIATKTHQYCLKSLEILLTYLNSLDGVEYHIRPPNAMLRGNSKPLQDLLGIKLYSRLFQNRDSSWQTIATNGYVKCKTSKRYIANVHPYISNAAMYSASNFALFFPHKTNIDSNPQYFIADQLREYLLLDNVDYPVRYSNAWAKIPNKDFQNAAKAMQLILGCLNILATNLRCGSGNRKPYWMHTPITLEFVVLLMSGFREFSLAAGVATKQKGIVL